MFKKEEVLKHYNQLPEKEKRVFFLHYRKKFRLKEIAEILSITEFEASRLNTVAMHKIIDACRNK